MLDRYFCHFICLNFHFSYFVVQATRMIRAIFILLCSLPSCLCAQTGTKFKDDYAALGTFYSGGEYRIALDLAEGIIAKDSTQEMAWVYKAYIHNFQKQYGDAARAFRRLASIDPNSANYWNNAGWFSLLDDKPDSTILYCNRSISLNGDDYSAFLNKAHAYFRKNEFRQAEYWYLLTSEMIPNRQALNQGPLADFILLDSLKPSPHFKLLRDLFIDDFALIKDNKQSNLILDSIYTLAISDKPKEERSDPLIELKKRFIAAQQNEPVKRMRLLSIYNYDVGRDDMYTGNLFRGVKEYISESVKYAFILRDSMFLYNLYSTLSKDVLKLTKLALKEKMNDDAIYFAQMALSTAEEFKLPAKKPYAIYNIGEAYYETGRYSQATKQFLSALSLFDKKKDREYYELTLNRLMLAYDDLNKVDSMTFYNDLLLKSLKENNDRGESYFVTLKNFAITMMNRGNYTEGLPKCLAILKEFSEVPAYLSDISSICETVGLGYFHQGKKEEARTYFLRAIESYKKYIRHFKKENDGKGPAFIANETDIAYLYLKKMAVEKGNTDVFFNYTEESKENLLYYLLTQKEYPDNITSLQQVQQKLSVDAAAISFSNTNDARAIHSIGFTRDKKFLSTHEHEKLQQEAKKIEKFNLFGLLNKIAGYDVTKNIAHGYGVRMLPFIYCFQNSVSSKTKRGLIVKRSVSDSTALSDDARIAVSRLLYDFYIKPHEAMLEGKKTLYISSDLTLNYIPFETLIDENGKYLADRFTIIYVPSFTIKDILEQRTYDESGSMMAFGNADYSGYHPEKLGGKAYDHAHTNVSWEDLEGTSRELDMIRKQVQGSKIYEQEDLSETILKKLSADKKLQNISILHFAVHGMGSIMTGEKDNTLIVTEPDNGSEDGYLQFYEAYHLDMHPRLVCLSACETAFGAPTTDGSSSTMATAFIAGGAGACIGTNWKVSDDATAIFMKEFYALVQQKVNYAEALQLVRKKFISGGFGKEYMHPFYWAPFKYYGF